MEYNIIRPLGEREGFGTFDTIYNEKKYGSSLAATEAKDYVIINFVQDEDGLIHFEFYHCRQPDVRVYQMLEIQNFPFGIDIFDNQAAMTMAISILEHFEKQSE